MNISTLSKYLIRNYLEKFIFIFFVICSALLVSNIFDLLNKVRGLNISGKVFVKMIFLKLPYLSLELLPLNAMLAMLLMNYVLSKRNEIVAIWSNGISIFKIIAPIAFTNFIIGLFAMTMLNPLSTYMLSKYEKIEAKLINKKTSNLILSHMGVIVSERFEDFKRIYLVKSLEIDKGQMANISIIVTDENNHFFERIDAKYGDIGNGNIKLRTVAMYDKDGSKKNYKKYELATSFSMDNFVEGVTAPDNLNFWKLPEAIHNLKMAGLPALKHQLYYYKILLRPFLMISMVFLASVFIARDNRSGNKLLKVIIGLFVGFGTFLSLQILGNILVYGGLSPFISIGLPTLIVILLSSYAILHLRMD